MSKIKNKKLPFSFHSLLSFSLYISHYFLLPSLFFSFLLLAFTHAVLQDCTNPHTLGLHFFSSHLQMVEWPHHFFLHLFLLFSLSNSSYQVTINASQLILTLLQPISFLLLSLSRMTLAFCFFLFFLPSNVSHKFNITYSFMWLDFCTSCLFLDPLKHNHINIII